jgi:hypothetical protein
MHFSKYRVLTFVGGHWPSLPRKQARVNSASLIYQCRHFMLLILKMSTYCRYFNTKKNGIQDSQGYFLAFNSQPILLCALGKQSN